MFGAVYKFLLGFARNSRAASAAEFAMVLPLLILFIFGIIDVGRLMWEWNLSEKATQMGVRYAAVTQMVPTGLEEYDFTTETGVIQGAPIDDSLFPGVSCTSAGCTCKGTCNFPMDADSTAFNNIVDRMNLMYGRISAENVVVDYDHSGLGFAGNPYGADVAPIITVRLQDMEYESLLGQFFGGTIDMGGFASSLTMEDGVGDVSN